MASVNKNTIPVNRLPNWVPNKGGRFIVYPDLHKGEDPKNPGLTKNEGLTKQALIKKLEDKDLKDRIPIYSQRRLNTVGRTMALLEVSRNRGENLSSMFVTCSGAWPQMFTGTNEWPACHTAPGLLNVGFLPLPIAVQNFALKRYATVVFGDCMQMPKAVNTTDSETDKLFAQCALVESAKLILGDPKVHARDATDYYKESSRKKLKELNLIDPEDCFEYLFLDTDRQYSDKDLEIMLVTLESHIDVTTSGQLPVKDMEQFQGLLVQKAAEVDNNQPRTLG